MGFPLKAGLMPGGANRGRGRAPWTGVLRGPGLFAAENPYPGKGLAMPASLGSGPSGASGAAERGEAFH